MTPAGKISRVSHKMQPEKRSHKRRDAVALKNRPLMECAYPCCRVVFQPNRKGQKYHRPECRKADWFESHFAEIPKAEVKFKAGDTVRTEQRTLTHENRQRDLQALRKEFTERVKRMEHEQAVRMMALFQEWEARKRAILTGVPTKENGAAVIRCRVSAAPATSGDGRGTV